MTPVIREKGAIPLTAWAVAAAVVALALTGLLFVAMRHGGNPIPLMLFLAVGPLFLGGYVLLVGFVYQDAKRRGMRYVMWTWLAILVPNGIGIILYFLLRDPIPGLLLGLRRTGATRFRFLLPMRYRDGSSLPEVP